MNFSDALTTNVADIERPALLPPGTYRWRVEKIPVQDEIADGRFDTLDFTLVCLGAEDDVDPDDLAQYGVVTNARMRHRFLFNKEDKANFDRSLFNLKRFLSEHLQIDIEEKSLKEAISESVNHTCLGEVSWRPDKNDPEIQYAELRRTAPLE